MDASNQKRNNQILFQLSASLMGILGFTLFVDPDFFWNPVDGVMPFKFTRDTFLESNHLDESTKFSLRGSGSFMFTACFLAPLFASKAMMESKAALRHLSIRFAAHACCFAYATWDANPQLVTPFFAIMTLVKAIPALWLWRASHDDKLPDAPKSQEPRLSKQLFYVTLVWVLPWALVLCFRPDEFAPKGRLPLVHHSEFTQFDGLQKFAHCFLGTHYLAALVIEYDKMVNHIQLGWDSVVSLAANAWAFVPALCDTTGYIDIPKYTAVLVLHLVFTLFVTHLVRQDLAKTAASGSAPGTVHSAPAQQPAPSVVDKKPAFEPNLAEENLEKKKTL